MTTTKKDLIDRIAVQTGQDRTAVKRAVQSFLNNVILELARGNRLEFRDFGVFEIRQRAPRMAQHPKTLERVPVPAKKTVKFKVGRLMSRDGRRGRPGGPDRLHIVLEGERPQGDSNPCSPPLAL